MADAAARREARRKKILENAQNRMRKVFDQTDASVDNKENLSLKSTVAENEQHNEEVKLKTDYISKERESVKNIQNSSREEKDTSLQDKENTNESIRHRTKNTVKINKPVILPEKEIQEDEEPESKVEKKSRTFNLTPTKKFEFMRITGCLILAILARLMLQTGYGLFYVRSIILPFICFEAGLFTYKKHRLKTAAIPQAGSVMIWALMLCGIKADVIRMYREIMAYITAATEDLFFFLFCFFIGQFIFSSVETCSPD